MSDLELGASGFLSHDSGHNGIYRVYCWGCFQVCLQDKYTQTHTQTHNYAGETNIWELSEDAYPSQDIMVHEHEHVPLGLMQESQDANNFQKTQGPTGGQRALQISVLLGRMCQWHETHHLPLCPLGKQNFLLATVQHAVSRTFHSLLNTDFFSFPWVTSEFNNQSYEVGNLSMPLFPHPWKIVNNHFHLVKRVKWDSMLKVQRKCIMNRKYLRNVSIYLFLSYQLNSF